MGSCPAYSVSVFDDGRIVYEGESFVQKRGRHEAPLEDANLQRIRDLFHEMSWFDLDDKYVSRFTDCAGATITYRFNGREKTVHHYPSGHGRPVELDRLEDAIDEILGAWRWVGVTRTSTYPSYVRSRAGFILSVADEIQIFRSPYDPPPLATGDILFVGGYEVRYAKQATLEVLRVDEKRITARVLSLEPDGTIQERDEVFFSRK